MKKSHNQKITKVNVAVDLGIVDLINALSLFPELQTIESCQGSSKEAAIVWFYYGKYWLHQWKDIAKFILGYLGPELTREIGDRARLYLEISNCGITQGALEVYPGGMPKTVRAIKKLARKYSD